MKRGWGHLFLLNKISVASCPMPVVVPHIVKYLCIKDHPNLFSQCYPNLCIKGDPNLCDLPSRPRGQTVPTTFLTTSTVSSVSLSHVISAASSTSPPLIDSILLASIGVEFLIVFANNSSALWLSTNKWAA